jgi:hypothetical protein
MALKPNIKYKKFNCLEIFCRAVHLYILYNEIYIKIFHEALKIYSRAVMRIKGFILCGPITDKYISHLLTTIGYCIVFAGFQSSGFTVSGGSRWGGEGRGGSED